MGLQRFPYKDYIGGVNLRDGSINLESDEAQNALNVQLTLRGALGQRAGKTRFDQSGIGAADRADNLRTWFNGPSDVLMASVDGEIITFSNTGVPDSVSVGTAGTVWCFEDAEDSTGASTLWACNGVDNAVRWDGAAAAAADWGGVSIGGSICRMWRNRMILAGHPSFPQRLYFSAIGNPESFTIATDFIDIKTSDDDLDPITWLDVIGDYLVVFKRRSVWVVVDPITFANHRIGSPGCVGRFMSAELIGRLFYLADDGVYSTDGGQVVLESDLISPIFTQAENAVGNLNKAQMSKCRMLATRDRRLLVSLPTGASTSNDLLLEHIPELVRRRESTNETTAPWMFHDYPVSSMANFRLSSVDVILAGAADTNEIHRLFNGNDDDGEAIDAFYFGSWKSIHPEEPFERVRRINVEMNGRLVCELFRDFNSDSPAFTKVLEVAESDDPLWDGGTWDGGAWDPAQATALKRARPEKRARYHAVKYSNNVLDKTFTVYSAELVVRGGKEHT